MKTEFIPFSKLSEEEKDAYAVLVEQITHKVDESILNKLKENKYE